MKLDLRWFEKIVEREAMSAVFDVTHSSFETTKAIEAERVGDMVLALFGLALACKPVRFGPEADGVLPMVSNMKICFKRFDPNRPFGTPDGAMSIDEGPGICLATLEDFHGKEALRQMTLGPESPEAAKRAKLDAFIYEHLLDESSRDKLKAKDVAKARREARARDLLPASALPIDEGLAKVIELANRYRPVTIAFAKP